MSDRKPSAGASQHPRRHMSNLLRQIAHETDAMEIKLLRSLYDRADTKLAALARMQETAE